MDPQTYLLLRAEEHLHQDRVGEEVATYQVEDVAYNVAVSDALYNFAPTSATTVVRSPEELKSALARVLASH